MGKGPHKNMIRFYRTLNELSLSSLGRLLGKASRTMRRFEEGIQSPSLEFAWELADLFNVELHELFYRGETPPEKRIVYITRRSSTVQKISEE